jgi:hypothetical protein
MTRWLEPEFADSFPVAALMKWRHPDNWIRIHSLPESQRWPTNDSERRVILERYASFGTAILGSSAPCYLIIARVEPKDLEIRCSDSFDWTPLRKVHEADEDYWHARQTEITWQPTVLRDLLLDIAEDRDYAVIFLSKTSDGIFAPYDGGADGFVLDGGMRHRLHDEFEPWLSPREDGL